MWTRALFSLGLAVSVGACASGPVAEEDPNAPQACVRVDNSGGTGTAGRVFLVNGIPDDRERSARSGERIRIGQVSMGRQLDYCFRRSNFSGNWYLLVEEVGADRLDPANRVNIDTDLLRDVQQTSQTFYLTPGDRVVWNVHLDRITVERIGG